MKSHKSHKNPRKSHKSQKAEKPPTLKNRNNSFKKTKKNPRKWPSFTIIIILFLGGSNVPTLKILCDMATVLRRPVDARESRTSSTYAATRRLGLQLWRLCFEPRFPESAQESF